MNTFFATINNKEFGNSEVRLTHNVLKGMDAE